MKNKEILKENDFNNPIIAKHLKNKDAKQKYKAHAMFRCNQKTIEHINNLPFDSCTFIELEIDSVIFIDDADDMIRAY